MFRAACLVSTLLAASALAAEPVDLTTFPDLTYAALEGEKLKLDLVVPKTPGPHPCIVCFHGGAWKAGSRKDLTKPTLFAPGGKEKGKEFSMLEMLARRGYAAASVSYRFAPQSRFPAQIEDAKTAVRFLRANAEKYDLDTERFGSLGFSAGGHLAAAASNNFDKRTYEPVDDADKASCRPDFALLIYPAYLTVKEQGDKISPELPITANTPQTFLVMTQDDGIRVECALYYYLALKQAKVSAELHLYPTGGHGYGLRPSAHGVTTWPQRAEEWMKARGLLAAGK